MNCKGLQFPANNQNREKHAISVLYIKNMFQISVDILRKTF